MILIALQNIRNEARKGAIEKQLIRRTRTTRLWTRNNKLVDIDFGE